MYKGEWAKQQTFIPEVVTANVGRAREVSSPKKGIRVVLLKLGVDIGRQWVPTVNFPQEPILDLHL